MENIPVIYHSIENIECLVWSGATSCKASARFVLATRRASINTSKVSGVTSRNISSYFCVARCLVAPTVNKWPQAMHGHSAVSILLGAAALVSIR